MHITCQQAQLEQVGVGVQPQLQQQVAVTTTGSGSWRWVPAVRLAWRVVGPV
jgi:hypothetical protein